MKKKISLMVILVIAILAIVFFDKIISFTINIQWFKEVGYLKVYFTKLLAVIKFLIPIFLICFFSLWFYYKSLRKSIIKKRGLVEINSNSKKIEKKLFIVADLIISFTIAYSVSINYWYRLLQFTNAPKFNIKDPIFHLDISFFIFKLPLIESFYKIIMMLLILFVVVTLILYLILSAADKINASIERKTRKQKIDYFKSGITKFAGKQLAVVSFLILLFLSLGYWIKALNLDYSPRGVVFGASYTDVHVTLLFYRIIMIVSLIAAIIVIISILKSKIKPIFLSVTCILVLVILEPIVSNGIQYFIVTSNERTLEQPYIKYNIDYTRKAFNIGDIQENSFPVRNDLTKKDIEQNMDTIDNLKINSVKPALEFYNQTQIMRYYYGFSDIDIDRYNIDNKYTQVFVAPREIDLESLQEKAGTWQNLHLVYTHGFGVVMSKVNSVTSDGQPDFVIKDIPHNNTGGIKLDNMRLYFGEKTNEYAIVNNKIGEFDYPKGGDNAKNNYDGKSGIKMNFINKILFAINKRDMNFLLSRAIDSNSKILINRNILDRVKKVAPFLKYDSDPYLVINEGKLYWLLDGYTTSDRYPFAQAIDGVNYIRNSVKVIVDAYNGDMNFYIMDKNDPIIKSYSNIFPGLFKDSNQIPSEIKNHFRYPANIFNIQCKALGKYHVTDPGVFYNGEDLWEIGKNKKSVDGEQTVNEASYMTMKLPGKSKEEMVLVEYFNVRGRDNMVSLLAASMNKDNYGKMDLYKFPPEKTVYSPYLFKQKINQDTTISKEISLWNKEGSQVKFGDTVIIPIKNSLIYVEPLYLRANGKNSIPEMKRIIVMYSDKMVIAKNIDSAFGEIFGAEVNKEESKNTSNSLDNVNDISSNIKKASELYNKALEAQKNGEWSKYGDYIKELGDILNKLNKK